MSLAKDSMGRKKECGTELSRKKQTKAKDIEPQTTPLWGHTEHGGKDLQVG